MVLVVLLQIGTKDFTVISVLNNIISNINKGSLRDAPKMGITNLLQWSLTEEEEDGGRSRKFSCLI